MSDPAVPTLESAVKLHQSGQINKAAAAYRKILDATPDDAQALHLLGVTHIQNSRPDEAVNLIERAIQLQPNTGTFHLNLASAYLTLRRIDEAIENAEKAIALDPNLAARGYHTAGLAFGEAGQLEDAAYCFAQAVEADPQAAESYLMLAISLDRQGKNDAGAVEFEKALSLTKENVAKNPNDGAAQRLLARLYHQAGRIPEAVATYRIATTLLPGDPTIFYALGQVLQYDGKRDEAFTCFNLALRMNPNYADAHVAVGAALARGHRPAEAVEHFKEALALNPGHAEAQGHLAAALTQLGQIDEAIAAGRKAVEMSPGSSSIHSTLLLTLHYSPDIAPPQMFAEHRAWAERHADPLAAHIAPHANDKDPDRPLRIAFLSADFKQHPVSKFVIPVLARHDRADFHIVCYSDVEYADDITAEVQKGVDGWRRIVSWSDQRLANQIREDRIDILIDLAGHTGTSDRLLLLARKPAPVQITQFGYPDTTGLLTMDYRVTDELSDPPGTTERFYTEKLARLPRCAYCYHPTEPEPRIEVRPADQPIVFGSVNNVAKLSPPTLRTWGRILEAMPDARLAVLATSGDVERTARLLTAHGIDGARLQVLPRTPAAKFLELFNLFDISLDPFPYNGGVTTCDALWMGVPVITLAGSTYVSRQGVSLLTSAGLPELVANTQDDYVAVATRLAADRDRLARLRATLRETIQKSPICDYAGYTAELQSLWRQAWRAYCGFS
jgi:predicted O-linked N-acetylglucosamine transferase (SPINDLY family)